MNSRSKTQFVDSRPLKSILLNLNNKNDSGQIVSKVILMKTILGFLVMIIVAVPVFAGEEIQLAAALGSGSTKATTGGSGAIGSGASTPAKTTGTATTTAASATGMGTGTKIAIGVLGAGAIAALAGTSSTSNH